MAVIDLGKELIVARNKARDVRFDDIRHIDGELELRSFASSPGSGAARHETECSAVVASGAEAAAGSAQGAAAAAGAKGGPGAAACAAAADPLIAWGGC